MHVGEIVTGRKARYRLTEALLVVRKVPSVYKAEALADERALIPARWFVDR